MPRNSRRAFMRSRVEEMGLRKLLKIDSFRHSQIDQQTEIKIERREADCKLHQRNPSCTEEKHR